MRLGLSTKSDSLLHKSSAKESLGWIGDLMVGASLGPVFSACSPTYVFIFATILPQDFGVGIINLIIYISGLASVLGLISVLGQKFISRFKWAANPKSLFKRGLGILFVLIGLSSYDWF